MAATVLERGARSERWDGRSVPISIVASGEIAEPGDLGSILGSPVSAHVQAVGGASLADLLRRATEGTAPEWVVVVGSAADPHERAAVGPPGDGAAAFLFDDRPEAVPLALPPAGEELPGSGGSLARAFALARARREPRMWVGDWDADPAAGPRWSHPPGGSGSPSFTVSQGAFVPTPRYEESRPSRWRFLADRCGSCGQRTFPARGRCRACGRSDALRSEPLPLNGARVVAATWIGKGAQPTEFDQQVETSGPYGVVLAEVAPDVRVTLTVTDALPQEVRVGSTVDTALRRLYPIEGLWRYGRKAVPAARPPGSR